MFWCLVPRASADGIDAYDRIWIDNGGAVTAIARAGLAVPEDSQNFGKDDTLLVMTNRDNEIASLEFGVEITRYLGSLRRS